MESARRIASHLPKISADRIELARSQAAPPPFEPVLKGDFLRIIAEVKRASPSRGEIRADLSAARQAFAYEEGGAAALSILTEGSRFGGSNADIAAARSKSTLPIVKKDFHVVPEQLIEARLLGASAALIIVRAVSPADLESLAEVGRQIRLELLFEVRDETELGRALSAGARIIGVNNRNLETLEVDPATVQRIVPLIPIDCVAIAESGYASAADIEAAALAGADAVLVGSALSLASDPRAAVSDISRVIRRGSVRKRDDSSS